MQNHSWVTRSSCNMGDVTLAHSSCHIQSMIRTWTSPLWHIPQQWKHLSNKLVNSLSFIGFRVIPWFRDDSLFGLFQMWSTVYPIVHGCGARISRRGSVLHLEAQQKRGGSSPVRRTVLGQDSEALIALFAHRCVTVEECFVLHIQVEWASSLWKTITLFIQVSFFIIILCQLENPKKKMCGFFFFSTHTLSSPFLLLDWDSHIFSFMCFNGAKMLNWN